MKINGINLNNFNIQNIKNNFAQNIQTENYLDYNKTLHPAEALGRSQVNFKGGNFVFSDDDRKFIDVVASNIRMSNEEKGQFEDAVANYLQENHFKSLDNIYGDEHAEEQGEFIEIIGVKLGFLSDMDFNMLADELIERTGYEDHYEPIVDKYRKDFEVVDYILDKYEMDEGTKIEIFDVLQMEAEHNGYDTVFDIFKENPERPLYLFDRYIGMDSRILPDLLIDFGSMAMCDEKERHSKINPYKFTAKMNEESRDYAISSDFIDKFGLDEDEDEYIAKQLARRRNGVSSEQIAYELIEKYDLLSQDYKYMLGTIYNFDANFYDENEAID